MRPPGTGTVAVSVYGSRADIPVTVWTELFGGALEAIDILVYGGTFLFDGVARFPKLLTAATDRGVAVRFIIGDPDSAAVAQRGAEEQIGSSLAGRCRMTLARLQPLVDTLTRDSYSHHAAVHLDVSRRRHPHRQPAPLRCPSQRQSRHRHQTRRRTRVVARPPSRLRAGLEQRPPRPNFHVMHPSTPWRTRWLEPTITTIPTRLPRTAVVPSTTAVVTDDQNRIVLIRRRDNDLWALPGGGMELGESIIDTAVREVKEETGLEVEVNGLVGVYTNPHHVMAYTDGEVRQQFSLCFTTRLVGGDLLIDSESTDIAWTYPQAISSLNMHPSMRLRIQHYLEHRSTPYLG